VIPITEGTNRILIDDDPMLAAASGLSLSLQAPNCQALVIPVTYAPFGCNQAELQFEFPCITNKGYNELELITNDTPPQVIATIQIQAV